MNSAFNRLTAHLREPLYRNGYALVFSSVVNSGLGMIYWILAAQNYPTEIIGINSAIISTVSFLAYISQLNLTNVLNRFLPAAGRASRQVVGYSHLLSLVVTMLSTLIFVLTINFWAPDLGFLGSTFSFALWFIVAAMVWNIFTLQDSALVGLRKAVWVPVKNLFFTLAKIGFLIFFVKIFPNYGVFASWNVAVVITIFPTLFFIFRTLIPQHNQDTFTRERKINLSLISKYLAGDYFGSLISQAVNSLLPIIIIAQINASANAYYYMASSISYMLYLVSRNMGMSLVAEAAHNEEKLKEYAFRIFIQTGRILAPLVLLITLGAPYLLRLFGKSYEVEGMILLRLLSLSALPNMIVALYTSIVRVQERIPQLFASLAVPYLLILTFSYLLMKPMGVIGVGMAWLLGQSIVAAYLLLTQFRTAWWKSFAKSLRKER